MVFAVVSGDICIFVVITIKVREIMKNFIAVLLLSIFFINPIMAYELDTSIDAEIKQKYDANKLNEEMLPKLPANLKNSAASPAVQTTTSVPKTTPVFDSTKVINIIKNNTSASKTGTRIPRWTKFELKSSSKLTSWFGANTSINFTSVNPVVKGNITIPAGTKFSGTVVKTHASQITGNGGLVEVKVTSFVYNGKTVPINAVVIKVNGENIFFNRIKGARQYINGVKNKITSATNAYKKGRSVSTKLSSNPIGTILSPIPTIGGFLAGTVGTVASPLTGLIQKGKDVNIPAGTLYEIKLIEDAYVN